METKIFEPEVTAADDRGHARFIVATMNTPDLDGDVTLPGFFGKQHVTLLPSHDAGHVPLGKGTLFEQGDQAVADVRFNLAIPAARDWFEAMKFDHANPPSLTQVSYGFSVKAGGSRPGEHKGRRVRFLQPLADGSPGVIVHEVSMVLIAAGIGTQLVSVKHSGIDPATTAELRAIHDRLKRVEERERDFQRMASAEAASIAAKFYRELEHTRCAEDFDWYFKGVHDVEACSAEYVPEERKLLARGVARLASRMVGLKRPVEIRWFRQPAGRFSLYGRANPRLCAIHLNRDLSPSDLLLTTAHEIRHLVGDGEGEARAFEQVFVDHYQEVPL